MISMGLFGVSFFRDSEGRLFALSLLLVVMAFSLVLVLSSGSTEAGSVPHGPIVISDDAGFNSTNGVVSGTGTASDPYVIRDWSINASDEPGLFISNTERHFIVTNITIYSPSTTGSRICRLEDVSNGTLEQIEITRFGSTVRIFNCDNVVLSNITITSSYGEVEVYDSPGTVLTDVDLNRTESFSDRISISRSDGSTLFRCDAGQINVASSSGSRIIECNGGYLSITGSDSCIIRDCTIDSEEWHGLDVKLEGRYHKMMGCTLGVRGVNLTAHGYHDLGLTNTVGNKTLHYYLNQSNIRVDKDAGQIFFIGCTNVTVADLTFHTVHTPITLWRTNKIILENLTLGGYYSSVVAGACYDFIVRDNVHVADEGWSWSVAGYRFVHVTDLVMNDVLIEPGFESGLVMIYFRFTYRRYGSLTLSNVTILEPRIMGIGLADGDGQNITIDRCLINGTEEGISISHHRTLSISNSTITNCTKGIELITPDNREGSSASISNNHFYLTRIGMALNRPEDLIVSGNEFSRCSDRGIYIDTGENCVIRENIISSSRYGIIIQSLSNCSIFLNTITNCTTFGVYLSLQYLCEDSYIYNNNLILNNYDFVAGEYKGPQAGSPGGYNPPAFYKGSEGNYWSDYLTRYPDAKPLNERVWDTPYALDGPVIVDPFPLRIMADWTPPIANAGEDMTVPENTTVRLDASNSTDNIGIAKYRWEIDHPGGNDVSFEKAFSITLSIPGTATVILEVWDQWGNSGKDVITIKVLDITPPVASAGLHKTVDPGEDFTLNGADSTDNVGIVNYTWTIDPGGLNLTLYGPKVTVNLTQAGIFIVRLRVEDAAGHWAEDELTLTVMDYVPPVANAGEDVLVDQGTEVELDGRESYDNYVISSWSWSFEYDGEQIVLEGAAVTFVFNVPGKYDVSLRVIDTFGLSDTDIVIVEVKDTEPPVAEAGPNIEVDQGNEVLLDGRLSTDNVRIVSYLWTIEAFDGTVNMTGDVAPITILEIGTYHVTLKVVDLEGNWAEDFLEITVLDAEPPIAEAGEDVTIEEGTALDLNGSGSTDNIGIVSYSWTFRDGTATITLQGGSVKYAFQTPGTYQVHLSVMDARGFTSTDQKVVTVIEGEYPMAYAGKDQRVIVGSIVTFDGSGSTDNIMIITYTWTFEYQGSTRELIGETATFTFNEEGIFEVTLVVVDAGRLGTRNSMNVTVLPPEASWRLGPFENGKGEPLEGVNVQVTLNGTLYEGITDEDGWLILTIPWHQLVSPAQVTATKDGYKPLDLEVSLKGNGMPSGDVPALRKKDKADSPGPGAFLALSCLATAVVALYMRRRH